MTWDEFHDCWLPHHLAKFPGLVTWLGKFPVRTDDPLMPTRRTILESWHSTLFRCGLEAAIEATKQLGTEEHPEPNGFGNHPMVIAAIVHRTKARIASERPRQLTQIRDGHSVYTCLECRDIGSIQVWHPRTMQAARDGTIHEMAARGELYSVSQPCGSCSAPSPARNGDAVLFDAKRMLRTPMFLRDGVEELVAFVEKRFVERTTWTPESAF